MIGISAVRFTLYPSVKDKRVMYVVTLTKMFQFVNNLGVDNSPTRSGNRDTFSLCRLE